MKPKAFAHVGLLFGTVGIPILGFLCTHCMHMLITTQKHLSVKLGLNNPTYEEV